MRQIFYKVLFFGLIAIMISGCVSTEKITYFQDDKDMILEENLIKFEPTIQVGDIITINVSSLTPEATIPFNLYESQGNGFPRVLPYIVDVAGEINFPGIGNFKVSNLTTKELKEKLEKSLLPYINDPIINVRITNFKVTVLGEVRSPGTYTVANERITILEAIGLAGDLTIQGKRKSVTLIREQNDVREFISLDLTSKSLFNSPYYYLSQNDVVYVEPNKARINSSAVSSNTSVILTSVSVLISIAAIFLR